MPRPKGSKNKKTLLNEARLDETIAAQRVLVETVLSEVETLKRELDAKQLAFKEKKRELRAAEHELEKLITKKEMVETAAAEAAQKQEIEKVISTLVSSGKSAEEILDMFNK